MSDEKFLGSAYAIKRRNSKGQFANGEKEARKEILAQVLSEEEPQEEAYDLDQLFAEELPKEILEADQVDDSPDGRRKQILMDILAEE